MATSVVLSLAGAIVGVCHLGVWVMRWRAKQQSGQALIEVTEAGDMAQMRELLANGADVTARNAQGWTPPHVAAAGGDVAVLTLLMQYGAAVHARSNIGTTPLYNATVFGRKEALVAVLLVHGAHPEDAWEAAF
jgi:ankyrin repeat protein